MPNLPLKKSPNVLLDIGREGLDRLAINNISVFTMVKFIKQGAVNERIFSTTGKLVLWFSVRSYGVFSTGDIFPMLLQDYTVLEKTGHFQRV